MVHIPKAIKYTLWSILALFVILLFSGAAIYRFDIPGYIEYLNTRDITSVTLHHPITMLHLFVPNTREEVLTLEEMLADTGYVESTGDNIPLDPDFEDFFSAFSQQDVSSSIVTGDDFGFVSVSSTGEVESGAVVTQDQENSFIEGLRQRELRLQEQAMFNDSTSGAGEGSD